MDPRLLPRASSSLRLGAQHPFHSILLAANVIVFVISVELLEEMNGISMGYEWKMNGRWDMSRIYNRDIEWNMNGMSYGILVNTSS